MQLQSIVARPAAAEHRNSICCDPLPLINHPGPAAGDKVGMDLCSNATDKMELGKLQAYILNAQAKLCPWRRHLQWPRAKATCMHTLCNDALLPGTLLYHCSEATHSDCAHHVQCSHNDRNCRPFLGFSLPKLSYQPTTNSSADTEATCAAPRSCTLWTAQPEHA
jgi:hypothetical protein